MIAAAPASHRDSLHGIRTPNVANPGNFLGAETAHHIAGAEEHQRFIQRVIEHVIERAGDAEQAAETDAKRDDAHVLDA